MRHVTIVVMGQQALPPQSPIRPAIVVATYRQQVVVAVVQVTSSTGTVVDAFLLAR